MIQATHSVMRVGEPATSNRTPSSVAWSLAPPTVKPMRSSAG